VLSFGILMWVGHLYESHFYYMFMYLCIAVLCEFLRGCVTLCVASLVACGFIRLFGLDLICLNVVVMVLCLACVCVYSVSQNLSSGHNASYLLKNFPGFYGISLP
jgi:hypothetical protein